MVREWWYDNATDMHDKVLIPFVRLKTKIWKTFFWLYVSEYISVPFLFIKMIHSLIKREEHRRHEQRELNVYSKGRNNMDGVDGKNDINFCGAVYTGYCWNFPIYANCSSARLYQTA